VVSLQIPELDPKLQEEWSARLFYAYADNLLAADRVQEAFTWFVHAAHADDDGDTDAPERLDELVVRLGGDIDADELVAEATAAGPLAVVEADESPLESADDEQRVDASAAEFKDSDTVVDEAAIDETESQDSADETATADRAVKASETRGDESQ